MQSELCVNTERSLMNGEQMQNVNGAQTRVQSERRMQGELFIQKVSDVFLALYYFIIK